MEKKTDERSQLLTKNLVYTIRRAILIMELQQTHNKKKSFRIKLNYRTFITVRSIVKVDHWLKKYPDAKLVG